MTLRAPWFGHFPTLLSCWLCLQHTPCLEGFSTIKHASMSSVGIRDQRSGIHLHWCLVLTSSFCPQVRNGTMKPLLHGLRASIPWLKLDEAPSAADSQQDTKQNELQSQQLMNEPSVPQNRTFACKSSIGTLLGAVGAFLTVEGNADDLPSLKARMLMYRIQAISSMGEYVECFGQVKL